MFHEWMRSSRYTLGCYESDSGASKQMNEPRLRWNFIQSVICCILLRNLAVKMKFRPAEKKNFDQNFFSSKIISNDQICIPIGFLRCLELPWKLWKQNIYVKSSIFLKIRLLKSHYEDHGLDISNPPSWFLHSFFLH